MTILPPPAAPEWVFYLAQPTGENIGSLQAARTRSLSFALDGAATAAFTMPGDHPQTTQVVELATDLLAARNGVSLFRGRVSGATDTLSADTITSAFTAVDYRGLLSRRIMWSGVSRSFRGADQADIAWQMIADTQALPGGALGITRGNAAPTGTLRDRDYDAGKNLGEALDQLGEVDGGYDWEIDANRRFNLYYPQRGRSAGEVLAYGRDIVSLQRTQTQAPYANAVRFNGSQTTTADELTVTTWDPELGRWDAQVSDPNLTLQDTVDERAAYELDTASTLTPAFSVTLAEGRWDPTQIWVGDTVRLLVTAGRLNVDTTRRIVQIDITLDDDGGEKVVLSVAAAPAALSSRLASYNTRINNLERAVGYIPDLPVGGMYDWPGATPPALTMWCDGTLLTQAAYPDLFAVIGTTFGSSGGPGTFNLPDCRSRMVVASGSGIGLTARTTGQNGGAETVALTEANHAVHNHGIAGPTAGDVPPHQHTGTSDGQNVTHFHTGTSDGQNVDHSHAGTTSTESAPHTHKTPNSIPAQAGSGATIYPFDPAVPRTLDTAGNSNSHTHGITTGGASVGHTHTITTANASGSHTHTITTASPVQGHTHALPVTTSNEGGGTAHQNMPPWIAIGRVIKVRSAQNQ